METKEKIIVRLAGKGNLPALRVILQRIGTKEFRSICSRGEYMFERIYNPLMAACEGGHLKTVKFFVEEIHCDVNRGVDMERGVEGQRTPLMVAAYHDREEVVRYLVRNGADIKKGHSRGWHGHENALTYAKGVSLVFLAQEVIK